MIQPTYGLRSYQWVMKPRETALNDTSKNQLKALAKNPDMPVNKAVEVTISAEALRLSKAAQDKGDND